MLARSSRTRRDTRLRLYARPLASTNGDKGEHGGTRKTFHSGCPVPDAAGHVARRRRDETAKPQHRPPCRRRPGLRRRRVLRRDEDQDATPGSAGGRWRAVHRRPLRGRRLQSVALLDSGRHLSLACEAEERLLALLPRGSGHTAVPAMTEFQRNTRTHLERLKKSGQPEVLTVNGQAEVVVQDAVAYQTLVDKLEAIEGIRKGLESMARGEGRSVVAFFDEFERKHAIQR